MRTDPSGFRTRWNEERASRWFAEGHWREDMLTDSPGSSWRAG
jgi:hypothetical protein